MCFAKETKVSRRNQYMPPVNKDRESVNNDANEMLLEAI